MLRGVWFFGLTGGIASGKSTVAARFAARGVPMLDADQIARDVVAPGSDGLAALCAAFGDGILTEDGQLDRKQLGARVFADPAARRTLNQITHPRIGQETARRAQALREAGCDLAGYEAALLVENGLAAAFRPLIVVDVPEATQRERLRLRDGLDDAEVTQRLAAQSDPAARRAQADYVLCNDGDRDQLLARADDLLDALCDQAGLPRRPPA